MTIDRSFLAAAIDEDPPPADVIDLAAWRGSLVRSARGRPSGCVANVILVLQSTWAGVFVWDEFAQVVRTTSPPPWDSWDTPSKTDPGEVSDTDITRIAAWLARHEQIDTSTETVWKAVAVVAEAHRVHPVREYLEALEWDGVPRLANWLQTYMGTPSSDYARRVGPMVLLSAVARVMRPGCKVDNMVVFEGDQGGGKSSAVKVLFGEEWTADSPLDFASKDRFVQLRGKWAQEIPELDGMDRADVNRIKSFLSSPVDDYRPPFGRASVKAPRQCVFVGTVNPGALGYLRDVTGNRRFWPVVTGLIGLAELARDRDQLWAEALRWYLDGYPWWPSLEDRGLFEEQQAERQHVDSWEDTVAVYAATRDAVIVSEVLEHALGMEVADHTMAAQHRVGAALLKLGRVRVRRRIAGRVRWVFASPEVVSADVGEG